MDPSTGVPENEGNLYATKTPAARDWMVIVVAIHHTWCIVHRLSLKGIINLQSRVEFYNSIACMVGMQRI